MKQTEDVSVSVKTQRAAVTIGNFDGVHLGHQKIIDLTVQLARAHKLDAVAVTFRPHPQAVLRPESCPPLLLTYDEKVSRLRECGLDQVVEQAFTRDFAAVSAQEFFESVLRGQLGAEVIVVGHDFSFGRAREGHLDTLRTHCSKAGIQLEVVPPFQISGEVVSSSRIRALLNSGDLRAASKLMGQDFYYRGQVMHGAGRGAGLGFPTANIQVPDKLLLPLGVYATRSKVDGSIFFSVTNVGVRPTFEDLRNPSQLEPLVETHILSSDDARPVTNLYGGEIEVRFVERLREERQFSGAEALKRQIADDVARARAILSR